MLNSVYIENYKGFRHLQIPKLGLVNLIWGTNNVGKSSLLEALSIYVEGGSMQQFENVLSLREEHFPRRFMREGREGKENGVLDLLLHLVHNYDHSALENGAFVIGEDKDKRNIRVRLVKRYRIVRNDELETVTIPFTDKIDDAINDAYSAIEITAPEGKIYVRTDTKYPITQSYNGIAQKCIFISSTSKMFVEMGDLWSTISMTNLEDKIIDALRIIEPRIDKFNILPVESLRERSLVPFVSLKGDLDKRRLSTMGDGINRILRIVLALVNCKDGVLFVDEIENGLHYSVQTQLWKIINQLAKQLNVQVFATTHSIDCISSFANCAKNNDCLAFRIDNFDGEFEVQTYDDVEKLLFAVNENIELR